MTNDLQTKTITISGVDQKMTSKQTIMFKIKCENNLTYTIFQLKKDGAETKAYQALKVLPNNGLGLTKSIVFKESQETTTAGKPYTSRIIVGINEPQNIPPTNTPPTTAQSLNVQGSPQVPPEPSYTPNYTPPTPPQTAPVAQNKPNWDKIRDDKTNSIKEMNALNNACLLIANGKYPIGESLVYTIEELAKRIYHIRINGN